MKNLEKNIYDPNKLVKDEYFSVEDYLDTKEDGTFNIGQPYEKKPAETLFCKHCGADEFKVGQGSYFTAVKCVKCEYEICVHDG